jgi:hypothetical protein
MPSPTDNTTGRTYKSRKDRPCDGCRKRKVACDMPTGPPCSRCNKLHQSCEFLEKPAKRRRPDNDPLGSPIDDNQEQCSPSFTDYIESFPDLVDPFAGNTPSSLLPLSWPAEPQELQSRVFPVLPRDSSLDASVHPDTTVNAQRPPTTTQASLDPASPSTTTSHLHDLPFPPDRIDADETGCQTLESLSNAFSFYVGPTGTADLSLLRSQNENLSNHTKSVASGLSFRRTRNDALETGAIFGITEHKLIENAVPRATKEQVARAWDEFWETMDRTTAFRLCRLYFKFVNPYYPVLSPEQCPGRVEDIDSFGLALLSGMCASAVPFMLYDETIYDILPRPPMGSQLYRLCWFGLFHELHAPTMATVQACLLLHHHLPTNPVLSDTAFKWSMTSMALTAAQTIGLHRNSLDWNLVPVAERKMRQRLWWAVWTMDKWMSLSRGMPTLINDDDVDVLPLETAAPTVDTIRDHTIGHFESLTHLTMILDDIRRSFYTVRAERVTATNLGQSLDVARPLRARLRDWQESLPPNLKSWTTGGGLAHTHGEMRGRDTERLDGNASLHLSYIITHMMLFRALMRPLQRPLSTSMDQGHLESAAAIIRGALLCVKELVEFLESLPDTRWNAFWHCWSRGNLAIGGCFMVNLLQFLSPGEGLAGSSSDEATTARNHQRAVNAELLTDEASIIFKSELDELTRLIRRWRWISRVSANGAAGNKGLTNLGLFKVETMLSDLSKLQSL